MHADKLGRPINKGDTVVVAIVDGLRLMEVTRLCITSDGEKCIRSFRGPMVSVSRVLVINREIEYTREHYPELVI